MCMCVCECVRFPDLAMRDLELDSRCVCCLFNKAVEG